MDKNKDKFQNFMNGFTASAQLLQRAGENGFFIEYTCLAASIIDGLLRIGLILKHQLEIKTDNILDSLLHQNKEDKIISERRIYQMALKKNIISQNLFDQLNDLYNQRNKVVHRYIISDISTKEVLKIGMQYEQIKYAVSDSVRKLEEEQIKTGVGMTIAGKDKPKEDMERLLNEMSSKKHGDTVLNSALKRKNSL